MINGNLVLIVDDVVDNTISPIKALKEDNSQFSFTNTDVEVLSNHDRNQHLTVRPELVEGLVQRFLNINNVRYLRSWSVKKA
jgi:hypothetical protein